MFALYLYLNSLFFPLQNNDKIWTVYDTNVTAPRLNYLKNWCYIDHKNDHRGMKAEQVPKNWVTSNIKSPSWTNILQLTTMPLSGNIEDNIGGKNMHVKFASALYNTEIVKVITEYWGKPFKLYLGWGNNSTNYIRYNTYNTYNLNDEKECETV